MFNRLQMPRFIEELAWLNNRAQTETGREAIAAIERLARAVTAEPHLYLKFVGD